MDWFVGTSGFDYADWRGPFYPRSIRAADRLAFYAEHFRTVELNVTFYRTPRTDAFRAWREAVPEDFRFAIKASRYLTHVRRLVDPDEPVEYLMRRARLLGDRLGVVLVQLPPWMPIELERLEATLRAFADHTDARIAVEARHPSWFVPEVPALLRERGAAFVLADRRRPITPLVATGSWTYLRLHEGRASPRSCYGDAALRSWVRRLHDLRGVGGGYVFFNNDHWACAPTNAQTFESMLERAEGRRRRAA
jgi:uncharacterized protein YecE (DUF72 family)